MKDRLLSIADEARRARKRAAEVALADYRRVVGAALWAFHDRELARARELCVGLVSGRQVYAGERWTGLTQPDRNTSDSEFPELTAEFPKLRVIVAAPGRPHAWSNLSPAVCGRLVKGTERLRMRVDYGRGWEPSPRRILTEVANLALHDMGAVTDDPRGFGRGISAGSWWSPEGRERLDMQEFAAIIDRGIEGADG